MNKSISTINSPEFINLQPLEINPMMSACEIKVLYTGENRNGTFISKETAIEMSKTLRGAPIVGYFKKEKEDFAEHSERITFEDGECKFECLTKPYGFVSPDAKVWFQEFEDQDDFGNLKNREYMMTTGYLWTGQFEECADIVDSGRPQSMELDHETMKGHWSTNTNTGMEFFIINDAVFSKLCILGNDIEPCFEGSSITSQSEATNYSLDQNFKTTLYTMMQDLASALKGGYNMDMDLEKEVVETVAVETIAEETVVTEEAISTEEVVATETTEIESDPNLYAKSEDSEDEDKKDEEDKDEEEYSKKEDEESEKEEEKEEEEKYSINSEDATELAELKIAYSNLESKYNELVEYKNSIEAEKKDELINSFYMLSDEDKKDVIENKNDYSLDEIEAKLSVICVRNKVNFDLEDDASKEEKDESIVAYSLNNADADSLPGWITAVKKTRDSQK